MGKTLNETIYPQFSPQSTNITETHYCYSLKAEDNSSPSLQKGESQQKKTL